MFTRQGGKALDERLDLDPKKVEQLMKAQRLKFTPNAEYRIPGAVIVVNGHGKVDNVFMESYTRVLKTKQ